MAEKSVQFRRLYCAYLVALAFLTIGAIKASAQFCPGPCNPIFNIETSVSLDDGLFEPPVNAALTRLETPMGIEFVPFDRQAKEQQHERR